MSLALDTAQAVLFDVAGVLPPGLRFQPDFISAADEQALLAVAAALPLQQARYKEYTARRRVFAYGARFDFDHKRLRPGEVGSLPQPLQTLRERLAAWVGVPPCDFIHVMVAEYQRGAPLGWHRDAPDYEVVAGISLGSHARLRFRPYAAPGAPPPDKQHTVNLDLAPRSAYVMRGPARWGWQHSLTAVAALRYSVTMRTGRGAG